MSNRIINARIKNKRDTDLNWQSKNPVLLNGEIILVDMNDGELRAKIGDGTSRYNQISFSDEILRSLISDTKNQLDNHTHPVDSALSGASTNPVQNKVVFNVVQALLDGLGDEPVSDQIESAIANKSDIGHTHDDRYYTESEVDNLLSGKAASSHGNHVPTTETANNAKFLRNDNTWQTVTPENIGAAAANHGTHVSYSNDNPTMDGAASAGSSTYVARSDHTHPTDTSRASASALSTLQGLVGDASVSNQISAAMSEVDTKLYKKANDYSIELYNGTGGNPKPVRFASFNYSTCTSEEGIAAKIGMVSGHGNGSSYAFLQDAIIKVNYLGGVSVDNFKYYGEGTGTYDGLARQYGDIFWLVDATNKIIDFYCLMGQYARLNMTPWKRLTYSSKGAVTQYTSCTVYSSGEKTWANNSNIALMSNVDTVVSDIQTQLNGKANSSHGDHVSYSTANPVMDGTASAGSASTVARSDHVHPTDTSRASASALSALQGLVGDTSVSTQISSAIANKADAGHNHDSRYYTEAEVNNLLSGKSASGHTHDDRYYTETEVNNLLSGKAASSHGTHVSYSTSNPVMDGAASVGSSGSVARSDHRHPTDTSRASASDLTALQNLVGDTAVATQISNAIAANGGKVTQTSTASTGQYPVLLAYSQSPSSGTAGIAYYDTGVVVAPSASSVIAKAFVCKNGDDLSKYLSISDGQIIGGMGGYYEMMRMGGSSDTPTLIIGDGLYTNNVGITNISAGKKVQILTKNERAILEDVGVSGNSGNFRPNTNGTCNLGTSSNRWKQLFASTTTISTSDEREKNNIVAIADYPSMYTDGNVFEILFSKLVPKTFYLNIEDNAPELHIGFIAQDIVSVLENLGLSEDDIAFLHHGYWTDEETGEEKDAYGLRYEEFIALNTYMIQKLIAEKEEMKSRLDKIEEALGIS